jgi:hypothetical protein
MERANATAALHKAENGTLAGWPLAIRLDERLAARCELRLRLCFADIGFVGFNDFARTAKRAGLIVSHALADAVRHEPSGFVRHAKHAVHLMRAKALLRRVHEVGRIDPRMQRDFGTLEYAADRHCERLAAFVALVQAGAVGLALHELDALGIGIAAMRAGRAVRPALSL